MNKVIVTGNICKDIELKETNGNEWVSNTIAVRRDFKNKGGEYDTDFISFIVFKNQARFLNDYCSKGSKVLLVGKWQHRQYVDNDGNNRYSDDLIVESVENLTPITNDNAGFAEQKKTVIDDNDCPF